MRSSVRLLVVSAIVVVVGTASVLVVRPRWRRRPDSRRLPWPRVSRERIRSGPTRCRRTACRRENSTGRSSSRARSLPARCGVTGLTPWHTQPRRRPTFCVFQDGQRATNPTGSLRVPQVLENLIHKKDIPVTIGIFITPGQRGTLSPTT